jgi:hypothetical protein
MLISPLLFNFAAEFAIRKFQADQERLELHGTHHHCYMLIMLIYRGKTAQCEEKHGDD